MRFAGAMEPSTLALDVANADTRLDKAAFDELQYFVDDLAKHLASSTAAGPPAPAASASSDPPSALSLRVPSASLTLRLAVTEGQQEDVVLAATGLSVWHGPVAGDHAQARTRAEIRTLRASVNTGGNNERSATVILESKQDQSSDVSSLRLQSSASLEGGQKQAKIFCDARMLGLVIGPDCTWVGRLSAFLRAPPGVCNFALLKRALTDRIPAHRSLTT